MPLTVNRFSRGRADVRPLRHREGTARKAWTTLGAPSTCSPQKKKQQTYPLLRRRGRPLSPPHHHHHHPLQHRRGGPRSVGGQPVGYERRKRCPSLPRRGFDGVANLQQVCSTGLQICNRCVRRGRKFATGVFDGVAPSFIIGVPCRVVASGAVPLAASQGFRRGRKFATGMFDGVANLQQVYSTGSHPHSSSVSRVE